MQRNKDTQKKINIEEEIQKKKVLNLKGVDSEKKHQHDKLMDEFKRAHRRMFNSSVDVDVNVDNNDSSDTDKQKKENRETAKVISFFIYYLQQKLIASKYFSFNKLNK